MGVRNDGITLVDDVGGGGGGTPVDIISPIGPAAKAGSIPVTLATDEDAIPVTIPEFDVALSTRLNTLGQKAMAASAPVVIASDQTPVPVDTELPAAVALADNTVNPTVPGVSAFGMVWDLATWDRLRGDSTNGLLVNLGSNNDVTPAANNQATTILDALNEFLTLPTLNGYNSISIRLIGSLIGTLRFDYIPLAGSTLLPAFVLDLSTGIWIKEIVNPNAGASFLLYVLQGIAHHDFRVTCSAFTSGSITVNLYSSLTHAPQRINVSDLTPSAPTFATIGVASAAAVAANASRKGLILTNTSVNRISLGFNGNPAVLDSGPTLYPTGSFNMDEYDFSTGAITAIASAAGSNLAIQELT